MTDRLAQIRARLIGERNMLAAIGRTVVPPQTSDLEYLLAELDAARSAQTRLEHVKALVQNWRQDAPNLPGRSRLAHEECADELEAALASSTPGSAEP